MRGAVSGGLLAVIGLTALIAVMSVLAPPAHSTERSRIFRCELNGHVTFTDQPCLPANNRSQSTPQRVQGVEVALPPINSYQPGIGSASASRGTRASKQASKPAAREHNNRQSSSAAVAQLRAKQNCQRLTDQINAIHSKMRAGYTGEQGERFRERLRQLEQRRSTERCH